MNSITLCQIKSCSLIGSYANRCRPSKLYCSYHRQMNMRLVPPYHLRNLAVAHGLIKRAKCKCKYNCIVNDDRYYTYRPMRMYNNEVPPINYPDMTIYKDIQIGHFHPIYWKQLAKATPLIAYLRK